MTDERFSQILSIYDDWCVLHPDQTDIAQSRYPEWERFYLSRGVTHDEIDDCEFELQAFQQPQPFATPADEPLPDDLPFDEPPTEWNDIDELTSAIIGAAIEVHRLLGPGLLEQCYERALSHELSLRCIRCTTQQRVPILYKGIDLTADDDDTHALRYDLLVEDKVVVELKSAEVIHPVHFKQTATYCKLLGKSVGMIFNFNVCNLMKEGFGRVDM